MLRHYDEQTGDVVYYDFECDDCGTLFNVDDYGNFDLQVEKSGVSPGTPDGPAVHWFQGSIACPECRARVLVGDSN